MIAQLVIAVTGIAALLLLQFGRGAWHRAGSFVGLAGQPFWLHETWTREQLGMFSLSVIYALVFAAGCLRRPR